MPVFMNSASLFSQQHFLSVHYVAGTILDPKETTVNKAEKSLLSESLHLGEGRLAINKKNN